MKVQVLFLFTLLSVAIINSSSLRKSSKSTENKLTIKQTPQGTDLKNHYGADNLSSPYGSKTNQYENYVVGNPDTFPITLDKRGAIHDQLKYQSDLGSEKSMDPNPVKSGGITNAAPSASRLITPVQAIPKYEVNTHINTPIITESAELVGKKTFEKVTVYDKETGAIYKDTVNVSNTPIYKRTRRTIVKPVNYKQTIDMRKGTHMTETRDLRHKYHGTENGRQVNINVVNINPNQESIDKLAQVQADNKSVAIANRNQQNNNQAPVVNPQAAIRS